MTTTSTSGTTTPTGPQTTNSPAPVALVAAALATIYVVWGSTYLAVRVMVEEMPPLLGSGVRALAASGLLAIVLVAAGGRSRLRVTRSQLMACAVFGLLLPVLGQGLVTIGQDGGAPSGHTALIVASVPLWVIVYRVIAGERPGTVTFTGVVVGFAGAALLVTSNGVTGDVPVWALLAIVVASIAWALGSWLLPRLDAPRDAFVVVVYETLVGGIVLTFLGLVRGEHWDPAAYSGRSWAAWAYLVVAGSIIGFSAYAWLLRATTVSVASTYAYVSPVVALFLGWSLVDEPLTATTLMGAVVVVGGVALVIGRPRTTS